MDEKQGVKKRAVKLMDVEIDDKLEGWAIVNEVGVGRWLGKVSVYDKTTRTATLSVALEMASPSRMPVLAVHPSQGQVEGVITGYNCDFVLRQASAHPVEDIYVSSIQWVEKMSEELRSYCFNIIADAILGPVDPRTGKRQRA
jgi:hypothetical protein